MYGEMETPLKLQGASRLQSAPRWGLLVAQVWLGAMPRTRMETEAVVVLLMMMLVSDQTASGLPGKPYYALHYLPISAIDC